MVANNVTNSTGADRKARMDRWTVISGAVLLMAAALTAVLAPEERGPRKLSDGRSLLRDRLGDTAPRKAAIETRDQKNRGRLANWPSEIPRRGWKDILLRVYSNISEHRVLALAAGMTYYSLLAIFPAIAALVAIYGLFFDPTAIGRLDQSPQSCQAVRSTSSGTNSRESPRRATARWERPSSSGLSFRFGAPTRR